jgi:hypothetical protein
MEISWKRRLGAVAVIALILTALLVPAASAGGTCPTGSGCRTYYKVHRGDTLTSIAYRFGTSVAALQQCNGIWNPDRIYAGQTLCICGGYQPCPPPRPQPKPQPLPCPPPQPKPLPPCPYPCQQGHAPTGPWVASYFNSTDLSGAPVLQQNISAVNFNWGYGSPGYQVSPDYFSARYQRTQNISTGTYRVTTSSDDGVRVSIDNVLVIDNWNVQPVTTVSQDVIIMNGNHQITIEYFEETELAELHFSLVKLY